MNLPTQPYKGARDFYPEDKRLQDYLFQTIRRVVASYGYEEYNAPILEPLELYKAKSGNEIVNEQTYSFTDRGGREVAIRPEMTPSVSRMVAAKRQQLAYPIRWFSIPNLWRYERPQRGRLREHWQLNVDMFGVTSVDAELELIILTDRLYKTFGADESMYQIKINHRQLIDYIFKEIFYLNETQAHSLAKLIDKKAKISQNDFIDGIDEIFTADQKKAGLTEKALGILNCRSLSDLPEQIKNIESFQQLCQVLSRCRELSIANINFDISIMRGFDYYSGLVFEVYDSHPDNNRSMMGGGRYDGLVGLFGVEPVPTVGFGLGDATLTNFLQLHNLLPQPKNPLDVYVLLPETADRKVYQVVEQLRSLGINAAIDFSGRKLKDQIKAALKHQANYALIVGPKEIANKRYTLRDLNNQSESELTIKEVSEALVAARQVNTKKAK